MPGYALIKRGLQIAGLALLCAAASASAAQATNVGWVFSDQPGISGSYTPDPAHSYNSSGGSITVTNVGFETGIYTVDFGGLYNKAHLNNVQVSAAAAGIFAATGYCTSLGWDAEGPGKAAEIYVACYDHNGHPQPSGFTLEYQQRTKPFGSGSHGIAFLLADQPTIPSYTPNSLYNYNSAGGTNTIVRNGTGSYTVHIPMLQSTQSSVLVTADTADSPSVGVYCKTFHGLSDGSSGTNIDVVCRSPAGGFKDTKFSLAYAVRAPFGLTASATSRGAWAWANNYGTFSLYTPDKNYQYNGFGTGYLTAQKSSAGIYTITIPGTLNYGHSGVLVTAVSISGNPPYCNVRSWRTQTITVSCFDSFGGFTNSQFDVVFQTYD